MGSLLIITAAMGAGKTSVLAEASDLLALHHIGSTPGMLNTGERSSTYGGGSVRRRKVQSTSLHTKLIADRTSDAIRTSAES